MWVTPSKGSRTSSAFVAFQYCCVSTLFVDLNFVISTFKTIQNRFNLAMSFLFFYFSKRRTCKEITYLTKKKSFFLIWDHICYVQSEFLNWSLTLNFQIKFYVKELSVIKLFWDKIFNVKDLRWNFLLMWYFAEKIILTFAEWYQRCTYPHYHNEKYNIHA